ncbi:amphi-Trp domain-containing protein [Lysinibacillus sp. 54212]|uniref:amphi-Trp domain-containing protein n=1 Tax=Lysinibacillus sp. 54212 TaxID=3119829 RepID=UPI002FC7BA29
MREQSKVATQVLVKHKEQQTVYEFATTLEIIAQKLKENGQFTFVQGTEQVEISPSDQVKIEYEYTVKGDKHSFEIEFDWYTGEREPKRMGIQ